ncbi:MAG TPA: late competence development ComFB family protein [Candidatus Methanoperedens sp.]|nr:late competence development ComFB family protein [Candidatus Methanoperedens sp.]
MKLANAMEQAVRTHLNQLREGSAGADETCWCPLCRADMMALALSTLPPRYATRRAVAHQADPHQAATVGTLIGQAVRRVERFPKHAAGAAIAAGEPVWVVNFPLEESFRAVDAMIRSRDGVCDCWNCRCDMVAFALNRYPPRYGVEHRGVTHLLEKDRDQMRTELASFLDLSLRVVAAVPRHEFSTATI